MNVSKHELISVELILHIEHLSKKYNNAFISVDQKLHIEHWFKKKLHQ